MLQGSKKYRHKHQHNTTLGSRVKQSRETKTKTKELASSVRFINIEKTRRLGEVQRVGASYSVYGPTLSIHECVLFFI